MANIASKARRAARAKSSGWSSLAMQARYAQLMQLDPDDARAPYVQVASTLRAAILTGQYAAGDKLPSGPELAAQFKVARMTVQQAIRLLRTEGLIVSRQGSGVFVRERTQRTVELRPYIEQAFEADEVSLDFAGFSAETLHGVLVEPLDKIRAGRLAPESIALRLLLPDTTQPMNLPCSVDDLRDDPAMRERSRSLQQRQTAAIKDAAAELDELGLVRRVSVDIRWHGLAPLFKLFVVNRSDVFFGFYPVQRRTINIQDEVHEVFDLAGKDAVLFRYDSTDVQSAAAPFVAEAQRWFDGVWSQVSWEPGSHAAG